MWILALALAAAPMNTSTIEADLVKTHGEGQKARIERGVRQVAALWTKGDGDLAEFAGKHFISDAKELDATLARFETNFEQLDGHYLEIGRELRRPSELDVGPMLKVDEIFAEFDAQAHLTEDLFKNKLGFVVLPNFPPHTREPRRGAQAPPSRLSTGIRYLP